MLQAAPPGEGQANDVDFLLAVGELFTLVVYGQLLLENARIYDIAEDLIDQIFDVFVRDFSHYALQLHGKPSSTDVQMEHCLRMIAKPAGDADRYTRVWHDYVLPLSDAYAMNP
jgi:acyl-CoA dehydrogenase